MRFSLGISTCPNDTFAFHALINRCIDTYGLDFDILLCDVQELNERVSAGSLDISKVSLHAALHYAPSYGVLSAGSALGFGVGPLLLSRPGAGVPTSKSRVVAPGELTTAYLLLRAFFPEASCVSHSLFSEIMPALVRGDYEYGAVIHEGRFVYESFGLDLVADLGELWERRFSLPLPLGGIAARHTLGLETLHLLARVVRESIEYAFAHRDETFATMSQYAQELSPDVIWSHVDLYVNQMTRDLGEEGRRSVAALETVAREIGILPADSAPLVIYGPCPE